MKASLLNITTSPLDERDIVLETIINPSLQIQSDLDYRKDMPEVWDQGEDGPCSSFAVAAIKMWQEKMNYELDEELSQYFIYNIRPDKSIKGINPRVTMRLLQSWGIPRKKIYNNKPISDINKLSKEILDDARNHRILGYATVNTIDGLKGALIKNGPAYIAMPVYHDGATFWKGSRGDKMLGGHALVVVGYNNTGFIIRNSWGSDWNGDGHTIYPYTDFGMHLEIWTSIDDTTSTKRIPAITPKPERKGIFGLFKKIFGKN